MRYLALLLVVPAGLAAWTPARAQHAEAAAAVVSPEASGCDMCHTPHVGGGASEYGLRVDDIPVMQTAPGGLGTVSRSCLRCHATPDLRARQPGFKGNARSAAAGGKYLQLNLADDHPLGRTDRSRWPQLDDGWADWNGSRARSGLLPEAGAGASSLECTTCHEPHSRTASSPDPRRQQLLCGSCHDPARYGAQSHSPLACSDCHQLHGGTETTLLAEPTADLLCVSCHSPGGSNRRSSGAVRPPQGHTEPPRGSCNDCHIVH